MKKLLLSLEDELYQKVISRAKRLGLSGTAFIRYALNEYISRVQPLTPKEAEQLLSRLIPVFTEALGRSQNVSDQDIQVLSEILINKFTKG